MNTVELISKKIISGNIKEALNLLLYFSRTTNQNIYNDTIILSCQLNNWFQRKDLGLNPAESEFNRIIASTTSLLEQFNDNETNEIPITALHSSRIEKIETNIKDVYVLVGDWEVKRDLAENPSERKRADLEINKLKLSIDQYLKELNELVFFQKKN